MNTVVPSRSQAKNSCEEKDTGGRKGQVVARKSVGREMKGHMVDPYLAGVFSSFFLVSPPKLFQDQDPPLQHI